MNPQTIPAAPAARGRRPVPGERRLCATPTCLNSYLEPGDGSGLCESCALERELFDREGRWERLLAAERAGH